MNNAIKNFLVNTEDTGRHIVYSVRTGKRYFIEVIGNSRPADWGSYNPSTGNIENKKGFGKFAGCIDEDESLITEENGFKNIQIVEGSPYWLIDEMDAKYPTLTKVGS